MDPTSIHRISQTAAGTDIAAPSQPPVTRELVQAVRALNRTEMFGQDNQLEFQRDPASRRMVIRIVNRKTHELVSQVPPEYVLRLAEDLKD